MDNEIYKLITRRYLAWMLGGIAMSTIAFAGVYGVITAQDNLITPVITGLVGILGMIIGFYFGRKVSEE